jgi:hypothetical protein
VPVGRYSREEGAAEVKLFQDENARRSVRWATKRPDRVLRASQKVCLGQPVVTHSLARLNETLDHAQCAGIFTTGLLTPC